MAMEKVNGPNVEQIKECKVVNMAVDDTPIADAPSNNSIVITGCIKTIKDEKKSRPRAQVVPVLRQLSKATICSKKWLIQKDLAIVCLVFLLHITSGSGVNTLQSSINGQLGIEALTVASFMGVLSSLLLPAIVLGKLGLKWSMFVAILQRTCFPASNFHAAWWTLFPGAAISGLCVGYLWVSNSAYITWLSQKYAEVSGEPEQAVMSRFFGVFFMFHKSSHLMSHLITSVVLQKPKTTAANWVTPSNELVSRVCASRYCYENLNEVFGRASTAAINETWTMSVDDPMNSTTAGTSTFYQPSRSQMNLLFGSYVAINLVALPLLALITVEDKKPLDKKSAPKLGKKLLATFRHMGTTKAVLLAPLSMVIGVAYSFVLTTFSLAFITCALGIDNLGFVMIACGAAGAICSIAGGSLVAIIGRKAVLSLSTIVAVATLAGMLKWTPSDGSNVALYFLAGCWGGSTAIIHSQMQAFVSYVYRNDKSQSSAHASLHLWNMTGQTLWQFMSVHMCVGLQLYVLIALLVVGLCGVMIVDVVTVRQEKLFEEQKMTKL